MADGFLGALDSCCEWDPMSSVDGNVSVGGSNDDDDVDVDVWPSEREVCCVLFSSFVCVLSII